MIGTGITIEFGSGFLAEILDVTPPGCTRQSIDTWHQGTEDYKTFTPSKLAEWGQLECDIVFDPAETPPIVGAAETVTIEFPGESTGSGASWSFTGFLTNYQPTAPIEQRSTARVTIKVSGDITIS